MDQTNGRLEPRSNAGSVQLLAGFARQDRRDLLAQGRTFQVDQLETFMSQGDRDLSLYVVLTGSVSAWRDGVMIANLGVGDVLNETKMFLPRPNQYSARAESQDTTLLRLPRAALLAYFRDRPERLLKVFVLNIVAVLALKVEDREEAIIAGLMPTLSLSEEA